MLREQSEQTGLSTRGVAPDSGWYVVFDGMHIAMLKVLNAPVPAAVLRNQILRSLVSQMQPEFVDIRVVNGPGDLDSQMPKFVSEVLHHMWRSPKRNTFGP